MRLVIISINKYGWTDGWIHTLVNPLVGTLKPQRESNGPLYNNTVIGTLAVDGWLLHLLHLVQRGAACADCAPTPSSLYQM